MNILIKSATIIDSNSKFHQTTQDILIENGTIIQVENNLKNPNNYREIKLDNLHLSQGWFDSSVSLGEPGYEERETLENGLKVAAKSGFTHIIANTNTDPVTDTGSKVSFIQEKATKTPINLHLYGALTKQTQGKELAEMYDMHTAGAIAFYDYKKALSNTNLMKIALQYAATFNGLICAFPQDNSISANGVINEHFTSTKLGLKGNPALSEMLQITRDLHLLRYTEGRLHIPTISTKEAVYLIREAKKENLAVSCSVAIHNLLFTDSVLTDFDTNYKVLPPLRTQEDITALIEGVKDGTIDMVTSDHNPLNIELKKLEFDYAEYGTLGLESAFGALNTILPLTTVIDTLTRGKKVFNLPDSPIEIGTKANLTLFNPEHSYVFSTEHISSKAKNSAFINSTLNGKVYGIIAKNKLHLN